MASPAILDGRADICPDDKGIISEDTSSSCPRLEIRQKRPRFGLVKRAARSHDNHWFRRFDA